MQNLIIETDEIKTLKGREFEKFGAEFNCCELNAKLAAKSGRREGNYITVQTYGDTQICKSLVYALREFVKRGKRVLVAGMGNGDVVADALGRRVVEYLKKHELKDSRISVFAPDVGALTNLDSVKLVQSVSYGFSPDYVVAVDALATARAERLGTCYQFTDSCLRPGGGTGKGSLLDSATLKTRFIAIGVPFIISINDLCRCGDDNAYYVPYDADKTVDICAEYIAEAIFEVFS